VFTKKTVKDIDVDGKRVLVCVDYNVPINDDGTIADDSRIRASIETLQYLIDHKCSLVLMSHLGRPKSSSDAHTSLRPIAKRLGELLGQDVQFAEDCIGDKVKVLSNHLEPGQILLLENVRYHPEEEANDPAFAKAIVDSTGAEIYVQECFGTAHRAHASTAGVPKLLPAVAGFLVEHEVTTLLKVIENPERPLMVVVGGAKITDKLAVLKKFIEIADFIAIGGAMANTFFKAMGVPVGESLVDDDTGVAAAKDILELAKIESAKRNFTFYLPQDVVVATDIKSDVQTRIVDLSQHAWADINSYPKKPESAAFEVVANEKILDIGPFSAAFIAGAAKLSKTAIWNGTMGMTEVKGLAGAAAPFAHGSRILIDGLIGSNGGAQNHPFVVVGGGDTISFIESIPGTREGFGHVSTGGGASLDLLAGKELPGVAVLQDK
jgi:phosphoglycerate kinase